MNTKKLKAKKQAWILDAIDTDGYEIVANTDKEKLEFVAGCLRSEAIYPYNIQRHGGNMQALIADHLQGLPSWLNIPFSNYDIAQLLKGWGYTFKDEKAEYKAVERYWDNVAVLLLQLFQKHGISL